VWIVVIYMEQLLNLIFGLIKMIYKRNIKNWMTQTKNTLLFFILTFMLTSCFKAYEPEIVGSDINKLVVSGLVTDLEGNQTVKITTSSSITEQEENVVTGCTVTISDDKGNKFPMTDSGKGNYTGLIDPLYLTPGSSFKVEILTPDGSNIVSDFDQFSTCPEVDSVYYIRKDIPTIDPDKFTQGIQFYVDMNGKNTDSRYYRWEAIETWKFTADYPIEWLWDGQKVLHIYPPDYSKDTCWTTLLVRDIFTLSTEKLAENKYKQSALHFVDNTTQRLLHGYSLLIKQYSMSEAAHKYWNLLRANSTSEGGLYERQPLASKGNLHNLTHPDQNVLGFFGVSSVTSKRIFIDKVENLEVEYLSSCFPKPMSRWGFADYAHLPKPLYLFGDANGYQMILMNVECVDCTASFGINKKPDFWP
jgi:hypothetical protein